MKRKKSLVNIFLPILTIVLILGLIIAGCGPKAPERENITIGFSRSLTGPLSAPAETEHNAVLLWAEQVNEKGGIYVKDIGKSLPVELVYHDDKSSEEEAIRIYERLITVNKVDLLLPPTTDMLCLPMVPIVEKYRFPMVTGTCGSTKVLELEANYWWTASPLSNEFMSALVDLMSAHRDEIGTVAVLYAHFGWPVEGNEQLMPSLEKAGFQVVLHKDYPAGVTDLSATLLDAKNKNPDALIALTEVPDCLLIIKQASEVGLNPKLVYFLIGPGIAPFYQIVGPASEGILGMAVWNEGLLYPGAKEFYDNYLERFGLPPDYLNAPLGWQVCQILEQAVDKAGTLDLEEIRDVIATEEFMTIIGPVKFVGLRNNLGVAAILQWQRGKPEIVTPEEIKTAELMIPKPRWP